MAQTPSANEEVSPASYLPKYQCTDDDKLFLKKIRKSLVIKKNIEDNKDPLITSFNSTSFPKNAVGVAIVVYQPGQNRIVIVRRGASSKKCLRTAINRLKFHPRFEEFDFQDAVKNRIQIDFFLNEPELLPRYADRGYQKLGKNRFEMGVDGLRMSFGDKVRYLLPGDAYVKSLLGMNQLRRYINRSFRNVPFDDIQFHHFRSESYVSYQDKWLRLFRGHPLIKELTRENIDEAIRISVDYAMRNQREDGRFLYYYDGAKDSLKDHEHPRRDPIKNPYYNMLRHSGGGLLPAYYYKLYKDKKYLPHSKRAIEFLIKQLVIYKLPDGREAAYVYYNKKSKLGGSGVGLYALAEYQHITGDSAYQIWAKRLKNHLLDQITETGEFIYYNIYLNREVTESENQGHFNFYYPGEAVIGLAVYYKYIEANEKERELILDKVRLALRFLLVDRPKYHADKYTSLPADSWLMMAINELWDLPQMREKLYSDFVFKDADTMVDHQYQPDDALWPDYAGAFYYNYGDFPYADGARAEGLLGAFELAVKINDQEKIIKYGKALKLISWAMLHLVNTAESTYFAPNPEMTIGGIRFKHTRQWFRIDTIEHVAAFYLKYLHYWESGAAA